MAITAQEALARAREGLERGEQDCLEELAELPPRQVGPVERVDLLERAAAFGRVEEVERLFELYGSFVYTGMALAYALRCAHEQAARALAAHGSTLLEDLRPAAAAGAPLPHDGAFTRFCLTQSSPTLFANPMDPTVSTELFEPFGARPPLAGEPYAPSSDLAATCELVSRLAREGFFGSLVLDDLLRAALVRAWHALRHAAEQDERTAELCLGLADELLDLRGGIDGRARRILASLVVPRGPERLLSWLCGRAPEVFLTCLEALPWLREDDALVARMAAGLEPGWAARSEALLLTLAGGGHLAVLRAQLAEGGPVDASVLARACELASARGHAETAAWLLAQAQAAPDPAPAVAWDDLLL